MAEYTLNCGENPKSNEFHLLKQLISPIREISSESLMANGTEVLIRHQGAHYHLRLTRSNKLILTK